MIGEQIPEFFLLAQKAPDAGSYSPQVPSHMFPVYVSMTSCFSVSIIIIMLLLSSNDYQLSLSSPSTVLDACEERHLQDISNPLWFS